MLETTYFKSSFGRSKENFQKSYKYIPLTSEEHAWGELYFVIEIINYPAAEAIALSIFDTVREQYFEMAGGDSYCAFENALKGANDAVKGIIKKQRGKWLGKVNAVIAVRTGDEIHMAQSGDGEGYLFRTGKLMSITDTDENQSKGIFATVATGEIEDGDVIVLSSDNMLKSVSKRQFEKIMSEDEDIEESLKININVENGRVLILNFMGFEKAHEEEIEVMHSDRTTFLDSARFGFLSKYIKKISNFTSSNFPKVLEFTNKHLGRAQTGADQFRHRANREQRKFHAIIAGIVILVVIAVVWGKVSNRKSIESFNREFELLRDDIAKAERLLIYDKIGANKLFIQAQTEAQRLMDTTRFALQLENEMKVINVGLDKVQNIERIASPNIVADLTSVSSSVDAKGLIYVDSKIMAYDAHDLYSYILDEVSVVHIDKDRNIVSADYYPAALTYAFYTDSADLIELSDYKINIAKAKNSNFPSGTEIMTYGSRMYTLDPENSQIWKQSRRDDGYTEPVAWAESVDLTHAVSMTIDGSIYVAMQNGEIKKIFGGKETEFVLQKFPEDLTKPTKIMTTVDSRNIYVLEGEKRRITTIRKDGTYLGAYIFEGTGDLRDFYIPDEGIKIFVTDGKKIYSSNL